MPRSFLTPAFAANVILNVACTSAATRPAIPDAKLALLRADSAAFETVVRIEISGSGKNYPHKISPLRVDSYPKGQVSDFRIGAGGSRGSISGIDSVPDSVTMMLVLQQRKAILRNLAVEEGGPFSYPQCPGTSAPPSAKNSATDCPKEDHYYVTIGLPSLGVPADLPKALGQPDKPQPDLSGEIWTVLVSEAYAGSHGQSSFQHAWFLRRDPNNRRLTLAHTELLSWVE